MPSRLCCVVGARPNFVKAAPVVRAARARGLEVLLVHTGQHYDDRLSDVFFRDLEMPEPDSWLGVGSDSHARQTAAVMKSLEPILIDQQPELVVVFGDVNSTLAAALVAAKLSIPIAHVEAGLRSFDRTMPEEINRIVTDHLSDLLFTTEPSGAENLHREGIAEAAVHHVGNTMIDSLFTGLPLARARRAELFQEFGVDEGKFGILTLHRPSNVDDTERLAALTQAIGEISGDLNVIFPIHPRTAAKIIGVDPRLQVVEPLGYIDFLALMDAARVVLTDSGGIQEETTALGVPCITLRDSTERPITVTHGTNVLAGLEPSRVLSLARQALEQPMATVQIPLWDGKAAERIVDVLQERQAVAAIDA